MRTRHGRVFTGFGPAISKDALNKERYSKLPYYGSSGPQVDISKISQRAAEGD
jgi:hypothetical protein